MVNIYHDCITGIILLAEGNTTMMRIIEEKDPIEETKEISITEESPNEGCPNLIISLKEQIVFALTSENVDIDEVYSIINSSENGKNIFFNIITQIIEIRSNNIEIYCEIFENIAKFIPLDFLKSFILSLLMNLTQEKSFFIYYLLKKQIIDENTLLALIENIEFNENNFYTLFRFIPEIWSSTNAKLGYLQIANQLDVSINENLITKVLENRDKGRISTMMCLEIESDHVEFIQELVDVEDLIYVDDDFLGRSSLINASSTILNYAIYCNSIEIVKWISNNHQEYFYSNDSNGLSVLDLITATGNNAITNILPELSLIYNETIALQFLNFEILIKSHGTLEASISEYMKDFNVNNHLDSSVNSWNFIGNTYYSSKTEAIEVIRHHAALIGFEIGLANGRNNDTTSLRCTYGMPSNNRIRTTKTNCPFKINVTQLKDGRAHAILKCSEHKEHLINTQLTSHLLLEDEIKKQIIKMDQSRISPDSISQFVYNLKGIFLIPQQIRKILTNHREKIEISETSELIEYIYNNKGKVFYYPESGPKEAVLTFTSDEILNMKNADCIYTDGTNFSNRMKWMAHPITTLNHNLKTKSVGTLFTSIFDKNVAKWFLTKLLFCTDLRKYVKTLTTDEDSSIMSVIDNVETTFTMQEKRPFKHLLCAYHKTINFLKHLHSKGELRDRQKKLWNIYVYNRNKQNSANAFTELYEISDDKVKEYLRIYVVPLEKKIIMCYIKEYRTYNHNTSGIGENFNFQIKRFLPNRLYSLLQMKKEIERITTKSFYIDQYKENHTLRETNVTQSVDLQLYSNPQKLLNKSVEKSKRLNIIIKEGDIYIQDNVKNTEEIITTLNNTVKCSCEKVINMGLPCSHIIAYFKKTNNTFPLEMIDQRYFKNKLINAQFSIDAIIPDLDDENIIDKDISNEANHKQLYNMLFNELKEFAKIGSESTESTNLILHELSVIREKLKAIKNGDADFSQGNKSHRMKRFKNSIDK